MAASGLLARPRLMPRATNVVCVVYPVAVAGPVWSFFALCFVAAAIVSVALTIILRRRLSAGPAAAPHLSTYALAYLAGEVENAGHGSARAVVSAMARLRAEGAILITQGGNTGHTGGRPSGMDELELAIWNVVGAHTPRRRLYGDPTVRAATDTLRQRVIEAGALLSNRDIGRWRHLRLLPIAALGLAAVLILSASPAQFFADPPPWVVSVFGWTLCPMVVVTAILVWAGPPRLTRAGRRLIHSVRKANPHLEPRLAPQWSAIGPDGAALAAALHGERALHVSDPARTGRPR
jgi:uncharacterized protein (TIGR04222 family)